ncbi:MAG: tRNA 2-thiocytidine(32) synthetase TtcA, partial [Clostridia bacterium]|nr:tRNA 2-thiocytidine(32) synthetase TtcA [Clostridia bacterium]
MKAILSRLRRAVHQFDMIRDGDSIAVGVSGGKDSMAL